MSRLLDLLFPPRCCLCGGILPRREEFCDKCGRWLAAKETEKKKIRFADACVAPLPYEEPLRSAFHRFKFQGRAFYARVFAPLLAACIRRELEGRFDLIAWVPISRRRKRRRGYDQTELLCRQTAMLLERMPVPCLRKIWDNPPQSRLQNAAERRANVSGAYRPEHPERFSGKRILLVDDVVTTGATMEECARVLLTAGAKSVVSASLASTIERER